MRNVISMATDGYISNKYNKAISVIQIEDKIVNTTITTPKAIILNSADISVRVDDNNPVINLDNDIKIEIE